MRIKAIQFLSVRVPSGAIVTLHSGNERDVDADDARWLLTEYPERVIALGTPSGQLVADNSTSSATNPNEAQEADVTAADAKPKTARKTKKD